MQIFRPCFAAALLVFISNIAFGQGTDLTGTWTGKAVVADGSEDAITLVLKKSEATYTGTISDSAGHLPAGTPIIDFSISGKDVKFGFVIAEGVHARLQGSRL